jgi:prophage regulatory protein
MSDATTPRLLRLPEVSKLTSLQRAAIYHKMGLGQFPAAIRISARCTVWKEAEILAWIESLPRGVGARPGIGASAA